MIWAALQGLDVPLKDARVPGYQNRTFAPLGVLVHHTASASGDLPSLHICQHGRPDLPGPLCQVLIGRANTVAVITDGYANHAGAGNWPGVTSGNRQLIGIELENNGTSETWPLAQLATAVKVTARLAERFGSLVIGHKEWAPGRKIDPSFDMGSFRTAVAESRQPKPPPGVPSFVASEEEDVLFYRTENNDLYAVALQPGGFRKHHITGPEWAVLQPANDARLLTTTALALSGIPDA